MRLDVALAAGLVVALMSYTLQVEAGGELSFVRLSVLETSTIPPGDDTFSNKISTDGEFRFGSSSVESVYVSTNGYISMGLTPTANAQNVEGANSVVAPYGADIDTRVGGTVSYTRFHAPLQELRAVSEFIEAQMDVDFLGTKMMVALWDDVAQYHGRASVNSTFQAVLITDDYDSYAVFIYQCGGMGWGGAEIGWQASRQDVDEHRLSGRESAQIGCEYSANSSAVVFRLESCAKNEFRCDGGRCLSNSKLCDRRTECNDGADEQDCLDITLIASGAAFGFVVLIFIAVSVCIFLYCLTRNKKKRTRGGGTVGLQTTPTESDATAATSIEAGPGSSSSVRETSFNNATSMYPKLTDEKEQELDSKEPPPTYNACASAPPAAHVPPENYKYQGYPAPTYPDVSSLHQQQVTETQPSFPPPPSIEPL